MRKVQVLVLTGYGTNSHAESAHAAKLAGADRADVVHFADLVAGQVRLSDYQFLIFPGGFLDGDDLGAAQAAAKRWLYLKDSAGRPLLESLKAFIRDGGLVLGICNGFQLMVKLGILPGLGSLQYPTPSDPATPHQPLAAEPVFERQVSLTYNNSARYEDRWVHLKINPASPCVFTRGLDRLYVPVRHGEGRLVPRDQSVLQALQDRNCIALQYADPETGQVTMDYPANPNGSPLAIAGLTNPTGRILGLMPHPEAFNHATNHPSWTRQNDSTHTPLGLAIFENAIAELRG